MSYNSVTYKKMIQLFLVATFGICLGSCSGGGKGGESNSHSRDVLSVLLNWDIPLKRQNGSDLALYDIDGYVVAYGTSADQLNTLVTVIGAGETSMLVEDLPENTYYFAVATVDSDGNQGPFSDAIEQTVM